MTRYTAACIQSVIREVPGPELRDAVIRENANRMASMVDYVTGRFGNARLVVLPEFSLQGYDHFATVDQAVEACVRIPGEQIEPLRELAREKKVYVAGNAFEKDPEWPGRWFNTGFLLDDNGEIILKYRKINCGSVTGRATNTSPVDIYTEYVDRYGADALFPVVDTPLGKLGMMVCYDVMFPEVARSLALNGAEVILHPTGEPYGSHRHAWRAAKKTRAFENRAYLISANHGAYYSMTDDGKWTDSPDLIFQRRQRGEIAPPMRSHGNSEIVDFNGTTVSEIYGPGEAVVTGEVDLQALRVARSRPGMNFLAQLPSAVYGNTYQRADMRPIDVWAHEKIQDRFDGQKILRSRIEALQERGTLQRPAGQGTSS